MDIIMAVDTNTDVHEQQTAEWVKIGIGTVRVDTMSEAIRRLMRGEKFLFIAINEDTIPDFWEPLRIMRDVTATPISVITSAYSVEKHTKAVNYGADAYGSFAEHNTGNVLAGLELLKLQNRWAKHPNKKLPALVDGDIILSTMRRLVLVKDKEVSLTKKEFEVLQFLMANNGCFLTHDRIMRKVWGDECRENGNNVLWQAINRLRNKLSEASLGREYIKAEREVGYKFLG